MKKSMKKSFDTNVEAVGECDARPDRSPTKKGPPSRRPADMDENYKGHHIWSVPRHLPESRRWTSHVVINWTDGSRQVQTVFEVKRGFATQEEAEREGLAFPLSSEPATRDEHLIVDIVFRTNY
jgi:hypothetical protein